MKKFLTSLGIAANELRLLDTASPPRILATLAGTGEFEQGIWQLPSGEAVAYEIVSWSIEERRGDICGGSARDLNEEGEGDEDEKHEEDVPWNSETDLDRLPASCLARVAANLSLRDLSRLCLASVAFRRLCGIDATDRGATDACWVERIRRHFGAAYLRDCWACASRDACCGDNPFARLYLHALLGLYRARPVELNALAQEPQPQATQVRLVSESSLSGALFPAPLLSPIFLGRPLVMEFHFIGVHPGHYDILLRVKKLLCDPIDSEYVASAADSSGVRVPLLQARINRRSVTISNFECSIEVTASGHLEHNATAEEPILSASTMSHLLQNYSMQPDRWFYWRLATLDLSPDDPGVANLTARVSVMRRGVADATVTQEEFERELRNALLVDHLFLRPQPCAQVDASCS